MNPKEIVKRAVEMKGPSRIPILYFNKYRERSDLLTVGYKPAKDFVPKTDKQSEWGFSWERLDDTMGQPIDPPITSWDRLETFQVPDPDAPGRFDHIQAFIDQNKDRYLMGSVGISGFNFVTFLRGFENVMEDFYFERKYIEKLIDIVFSFEKRIIEHYSRFELDAIAFGDDWGTQNSLMINPSMWREIFKPRYKELFDFIRRKGMHIYFHSCGYIKDIIPDFIELGVNILNLNQPDLFGIERLSQDFGGQVCFCCPVDHQTVAINGTKHEIYDYVKRLVEYLGRFNGGYIGYIEEYHSIGMSDENYQIIIEAFELESGGRFFCNIIF